MALPFTEHSVVVRTAISRADGEGVALPAGFAAPANVLCVVDNTAGAARQAFLEIANVTDQAILIYVNPEDAAPFKPQGTEVDFSGITYLVTAVREQPSTITELGHALVLADRSA